MLILIEKLRAADFTTTLKEMCLDDIVLQINTLDSSLDLNKATRILGSILSRLHAAGVLTYPDPRNLNPDTLFLYFGEEIFNQLTTNKFANKSCL